MELRQKEQLVHKAYNVKNLLMHSISSPSFFWARVAVLLFLTQFSAAANTFFEVIGLEGSASVERSRDRSRERLSVGDRISDNDLVETVFQSRITVRFGDNNIAILGSNSSVLFNISSAVRDDGAIDEVNFTLFSGGIFARAVSNSFIRVYTPNAVAETESGALSTVVEARTGETGVQVLGGAAQVRNIAQQRGAQISSGFTTMVHPGREPTAPLYITMRHVTVLKHFFGEEYITAQLASAGINPTEERRTGARLSMAHSAARRDPADDAVQGPLFNKDRIWGSILSNKAREKGHWSPIHSPATMRGRQFAGIGTNMAVSDGASSSSYYAKAGFDLSRMDIGLNLGVTGNAEGEKSAGFTSLEGVLSIIDYLTVGSSDGATFLRLGSIENLTYSKGLVVRDFRSSNPNHLFDPMSFQFQLSNSSSFFLGLFFQNLLRPKIGGMNLTLSPDVYQFILGYYYDADQYDIFKEENYSRLHSAAAPETLLYRHSNQQRSAIHIFETGLETELFVTFTAVLRTSFEYSWLYHNGKKRGHVFRAPSFSFDWNGIHAGIGIVTESGRMLSQQFGHSYMKNRAHLFTDFINEGPDTIVSQNMQLASGRSTQGVLIDFRMNPFPGSSVEAYIKHDYKSRSDSTRNDSSFKIMPDFTFDINFSVDETVLPFLRYASIFLRQQNGTHFPGGSSYFKSLSFESGLELMTTPLIFGIALSTNGRFQFLNRGGIAESAENVLPAFDFGIDIIREF